MLFNQALKISVMNHITFWGDHGYTGGYILWVRASRDLALSFGRFQGGRPVAVPAGVYAYVGSAMGRRGATALAGRLLRHATRSAGKPPHAIRAALSAAFAAAPETEPPVPPSNKRLHWHIDYLLDELEVAIEAVAVVRAAERVESRLARGLAAVPGVAPLLPGLGASDAPGETHLLRLPQRGLDWEGWISSFLTSGDLEGPAFRRDTGSSPP
jgi:Uri superfamily endonuclease